MTREGTRIRAAFVALVALALVGSSVVVARALILKPRFDSEKVGSNQRAKVIAKCPRGTEVVSGGYAAPARVYAGGGPYTDTIASQRLGDSRFAVKAEDDGPFRHGKIYAYAYCGDLGRITVASGRSKPIGSFQRGSAVAKCPRGLTAISGGWAGSGPRGRPAMLPYVSKRSGTRSWKVAAENEVLKGSHRLIAYAYCAKPPPGLTTRAHSAHLERFNLNSAGSSCAPGEEAISGGFKATKPGGGFGSVTVFTSHRRRDGARWRVSLINGFDEVKQARVFAYCVPGE